jgi:hypothetical protein
MWKVNQCCWWMQVDLEPLIWALQVHLAISDVQGRRNTSLETVEQILSAMA